MPGSADDPLILDIFQTVRNVGWGGRIFLVVYADNGKLNEFIPATASVELLTGFGNQVIVSGETILTAQGTPLGIGSITEDVTHEMIEQRDLWRNTVHELWSEGHSDLTGFQNLAVINVGRAQQSGATIIEGSLRFSQGDFAPASGSIRVMRAGPPISDEVAFHLSTPTFEGGGVINENISSLPGDDHLLNWNLVEGEGILKSWRYTIATKQLIEI